MEFEQNSKIKAQELSKFVADKKASIKNLFRQCDKETKIEIALGGNYNADCQAGNLIKFLNRLRIVCFISNNGGLSFGTFKYVVAVKLMNNYSNNKPHGPHGFKEKFKIKYNTIKAVVGRLPNGTGEIFALLETETVPLTWVDYCAIPPVDQLVWEERENELNRTILYLMNLKNNNAKKNLCLAYSKGNMTAYPTIIKRMAR